MIQGIFTVRQYFDQTNSNEEQIRNFVQKFGRVLSGIGIAEQVLAIIFIGIGHLIMVGR